MHIPTPWSRSNGYHRTPEKFTGRVTVNHDVSESNFVAYDDNSRPFMLTQITLDMFSFPVGEPEVDIELQGRRVTKALKADLRSTPAQIDCTDDKVLAEICEAFDISTEPADLIAQAFRK